MKAKVDFICNHFKNLIHHLGIYLRHVARRKWESNHQSWGSCTTALSTGPRSTLRMHYVIFRLGSVTLEAKGAPLSNIYLYYLS